MKKMGDNKLQLILYSKPGCHLCEGLQEKLEQIHRDVLPERLYFELEVRDITSREEWFQAYQYEVPVLCRINAGSEELLPRPSPRTTVQQLERMLQKYLLVDESK